MKKIVTFLSFVLLLLAFNSCCEFFGAKDLGNDFVLFDGDKKEDRIIIRCSGRSGGCCISGISIVPNYERHFNRKGEYLEYAESAKSNNRWIIAQTLHIESQKQNYWIIDKDAFNVDFLNDNNSPMSEREGELFNKLIQSHVYGPFDYDAFTKKKEELGVKLFF